MHCCVVCIVEPSLWTLQNMDNFSTKDTAWGPKYVLPITLKHFEPPKKDNLNTRDRRDCPQVSFVWRLRHVVLNFKDNCVQGCMHHAKSKGTLPLTGTCSLCTLLSKSHVVRCLYKFTLSEWMESMSMCSVICQANRPAECNTFLLVQCTSFFPYPVYCVFIMVQL
jgi:hypothetical protein